MDNSSVEEPAYNYSDEALLDMVNDDFANAILPATIVLGVESIVGFIGNFLVIIVYTKYYDRSNFKYFVLFLAYTDITSCMTCIPGEVFTQLNWYKLSYDWLCKSKAYFNVTTSWNSAAILILFSFDRFRKICYPLKWQMRPYLVRRMCICLTIASIIAVVPNPIGWEINLYEIPTSYGPVNASSCGKSDEYPETVYKFLLYFYTLGIIFMMLVITVLNTMTARKIIWGKRLLSSNSDGRIEVQSSSRDQSTGGNTVSEYLSNLDDSTEDPDKTGFSTSDTSNWRGQEKTRGVKKVSEGYTNEAYDNSDVKEDQSPSHVHHKQRSTAYKQPQSPLKSKSAGAGVRSDTTRSDRVGKGRRSQKLVIMFVVTMVFVITMTVYMITTLYLTSNLSTSSLSSSEKVLLFTAWRLYFVNYMLNPFLYGLMDQRFRRSLRYLFCRR